MQEFSSDGVRIAYIDAPAQGADRGEPIVLIHGFASDHRVNWVNPRWIETLTKAGRRAIALDNRGHGQSEKLYDPEDYSNEKMARDVANLIERLDLRRVDVMGYSMGARIAAFLALARPERVRSLILGGLGAHLIEGVGLPPGVAAAMEAASLEELDDPTQRMFRAFADQNGADRRALAACIRGSRETLSETEAGAISAPVLVAVGALDPIAGDPFALARVLPNGRGLEIPGRDHNHAVGDKVFKAAALAFLADRP